MLGARHARSQKVDGGMAGGDHESVNLAGRVLEQGNVPESELVVDRVAVILLASDAGHLEFKCSHSGHIGQRGIADVIEPRHGDVHAGGWNADEHVLVGAARDKARLVVQGEGIQVESALDQAESLETSAFGVVDDVLKQGAAHAAAEVIGMDVHDPQRDVMGAGVVETGAHEAAGAGILGDHGATRVQGVVSVSEDLGIARVAREDGRPAVHLIPEVEGDVNQLGHFGAVLGSHASQADLVHREFSITWAPRAWIPVNYDIASRRRKLYEN